MKNEFITIAKFNRLMDAYLVATRIESEGIECFLPDEMLAKPARNHFLAASQIRLQVKEEDVTEALRILNKNPSEISPNDMKI